MVSSLQRIRKVAFARRSRTAASPVTNNANGVVLRAELFGRGTLHCPTCDEYLFAPVCQCERGHIACSSCYYKGIRECSLCFLTTNRCYALEKLLESISRISCKYLDYGCKKTVAYSKRREHEERCPRALCYCPFPSCGFLRTSEYLYPHFGINHAASTTRFTYNTTFSVSVDINQTHIFLQEQHEGVIFILSHQVEENGRTFNVDCVGTGSLETCFLYKLTAETMETSVSLQCVADVYKEWSKEKVMSRRKYYLKVPSAFAGYNGPLSLFVCIQKQKQKQNRISSEVEEDDDNTHGRVKVVLTNPTRVLNCSICLNPLSTPIFQCEKGEIVCSSLCLEAIGCDKYTRCEAFEEVIKNIVVSCKNAVFGCPRRLDYYFMKTNHEKRCNIGVCFCPHTSCPFFGFPAELYDHFSVKHAASTTRFTYNTTLSVSVDVNHTHIFLQETFTGRIFILNHRVQEHGRAFDLDSVSPKVYDPVIYQLAAKTMSLKAVPQMYPKWYPHKPSNNCLTLPFDFMASNGLLSLSIRIIDGDEALDWIFGPQD